MTTPPPPERATDGKAAKALRIAGWLLTIGYLGGVVALLAWGALRRFELPQQPMIDPDIVGYLGPAVATLAGKPFPHLIGRSFPYPAFIYLILRCAGDFRAIPVVQHLLGLAAGAVILLAWNALRDLAPERGGIPRPLFRFLGMLPAYMYLGSSTAISFEHQIRPEAVFPFLSILTLWLSFLYLKVRFIQPNRSAVLWLGAAIGFLTCMLYLAKPSFGFATIFCSAPVWISLLVRGPSLREKAILAAAAAVPAFLLLLLPEHLMKKSDPVSSTFLPETVLAAHGALIEQQMSKDLAGGGPLPFPRSEVEAADAMLKSDLRKAPQVIGAEEKTYTSYRPDYLLLEYLQYGDAFCQNFPVQMHLSASEMGHFCMTWYLRTLIHNPAGMAAKIKRELSVFYQKRNPAFYLGREIKVSVPQYGRVARLMASVAPLGPGNPAVERYIAESNRLAGEKIGIRQRPRLIEWARWFSLHYLNFLAVALLSPTLLLFRPLRPHFLWLIAALWLSYSYNFGTSLTIAMIHSMELNRYVRNQLIFTIFAECLSLGFLLELAAFALRAGAARFLSRRKIAL
jgi:hypothetical protein